MPRSTRVAFSSSIQTTVVSIPQDEMATRWYTEDDKRQSIQSMLADAHRIRNLLAAGGHFSEKDICECMGIEKYTHQDLLREITTRKQSHVAEVLASTRYQDEKLTSTVSEVSSQWAIVRAR